MLHTSSTPLVNFKYNKPFSKKMEGVLPFHHQSTHIIHLVILYSGKFSQSNIFTDFTVIPTFAKFLIRKILTCTSTAMSGSGSTYTQGPCTIICVSNSFSKIWSCYTSLFPFFKRNYQAECAHLKVLRPIRKQTQPQIFD